MDAKTEIAGGYRRDIDGLRAVAVLSVVGFHAFPALMPGGFIGVDVFFVVSGYLITGIILRGLAAGTFSFRDFYLRRVRRILPALIAVLAAVLALGWFTLSSEEYRQLGRHAGGGATFTSNALSRQDSGYFDAASDRKPLLHLWSLAIEEQFYLLFPLILWFGWKRRMKPLAVIAAIAGASFAWNIAVHAKDPTTDYYAIGTRAWELMLGAALACVPFRASARRSGALAGLGILLCAIGAVVISEASLFPGWWALLPTFGTALLIAAGPDAWMNRALSFRPVVWFGLISYPLYLWHWPLLSLMRIRFGGEPSRAITLAVVCLAVALAAMTYAWIELPLRRRRMRPWTAVALLLILAGVGAFGLAVHRYGLFAGPVAAGLDDRLETARLAPEDGECIDAAPGEFCMLGVQGAAPAAFIVGDSHAMTMLVPLTRYAHSHGTSFVYAGASSCPPLLDVRTVGKEFQDPEGCRDLNRDVLAYVKERGIKDVILVARWSKYVDGALVADAPTDEAPSATGPPHRALLQGLDATMDAYTRAGVRVILLGDNPQQALLPEDALRRSDGSEASVNASSVGAAEHVAAQAWVMAMLGRHAAAEVVDLSSVYCDTERCPLMRHGQFLYADEHHLSGTGALLAYPAIEKGLAGAAP